MQEWVSKQQSDPEAAQKLYQAKFQQIVEVLERNEPFDGDIKAIIPMLGKPMISSGAKAERLLGIKFIPAEVTVRESAEYLIKNGFIKK